MLASWQTHAAMHQHLKSSPLVEGLHLSWGFGLAPPLDLEVGSPAPVLALQTNIIDMTYNDMLICILGGDESVSTQPR